MTYFSFNKLHLKCSLFATFTFFLLLPSIQAQESSNLLADKKAIVTTDNARFTVLTPQLLRMEWATDKSFDDHASFVVVNRKLPVPIFTSKTENGWLIINTSELELRYKVNSGTFTSENLKVKYLKSDTVNWYPGKQQKYNLGGTIRTLDGADGEFNRHENRKIKLEDGILARDGWYFLNDSSSLRLDNSAWPWVYKKERKAQDWYFIGYGNNYKTALYDFSLIAGKVPMIPRYAFGYWWSRYWSYSDNEIQNLVSYMKRMNIPIDVLVVDMDWHKRGWTGWSWNKSLFPDPSAFLDWTNKSNLKTTLNLHPADGVEAHEDQYNQFARSLNFDTTGKKAVPFSVSDKKYMSSLFENILQPMEKQGIDFWWLDWQQWPNDKKITNLSNTWWLNYVFYTYMERNRSTRPLLYHRWGGLGNHRYQIGFSGDTFISWKSLEYQPYFTNTASNVLYTYWSHDIGGHQLDGGNTTMDPELYTRWLQYGVFSPIMRTHSTKNGNIKKELWNYSEPYFSAQTSAIRLRYTLVPYIYTMSRKTNDKAIALCRPMYYDYPTDPEAYSFNRQYMFGDNMLISPIGTPATDGYSKVKVWLPSGNDWFEWPTGTLLKGGREYERNFSIDEYPIYVKTGSIIPMYNDKVNNLDNNPKNLTLAVYPGGSGSFDVYEDNGNDKTFDKEHAVTNIKSSVTSDETLITIAATKGQYKEMPLERWYNLKLFGSEIPMEVRYNGKLIPFNRYETPGCWTYNGKELSLNIALSLVDCRKSSQIKVSYKKGRRLDINNGMVERFKRLSAITSELKSLDNGIYLPEILGETEETNRSLEYFPLKFESLIERFNENYKKLPEVIKGIKSIGNSNQNKLVKKLQLEQAD
ncbi:glycoside hydrolase family 31 protein [Arcticibacter eurypsychrophilus]|uniref:glycoside hydrolase family 31 protein n=1 Tax=Arcticibacter eurypsychrophilus TaxID=1434752 RepID=UPI0009F28250|nr:glycoside hydrolase family 31 protein [Arcticibacter eurypsychrophilus]